jgi:hypothetical protein
MLYVVLQEHIGVHELLSEVCIGQYLPNDRIILPVLRILVIDL